MYEIDINRTQELFATGLFASTRDESFRLKDFPEILYSDRYGWWEWEIPLESRYCYFNKLTGPGREEIEKNGYILKSMNTEWAIKILTERNRRDAARKICFHLDLFT